METQTDQFTVVTDDGRKFVVCEFRSILDAGHMEDPGHRIISKLTRLETADGYHVSRLDDGSFQIVELGLAARKAGDQP